MIVEQSYYNDHQNTVNNLANNGIHIALLSDKEYTLETRFCVADNTRLMTGAFNWSDKDLKSNFDCMIVAENEGACTRLLKEFDYHWSNSTVLNSSSGHQHHEHGTENHQHHQTRDRSRSRSASRES